MIPPPGQTYEYVVTFIFTAAGAVSDYDETAKANIAANFAAQSGVTADRVIVIIVSASVQITVDVIADNSDKASDVMNALASSFTSAAALSTLAGVSVETITQNPYVQYKAVYVPVASPPPPSLPPPSLPPSPPPAPPGDPWVWWPIVVGVSCALCCCGGIGYFYMKKKNGDSADKVRV